MVSFGHQNIFSQNGGIGSVASHDEYFCVFPLYLTVFDVETQHSKAAASVL